MKKVKKKIKTKKTEAKKEPVQKAIHKKHKKSNSDLRIIGIIVLIVLIAGAVIATLALTKTKNPIVPSTIIKNTDGELTEEEFTERYVQVMQEITVFSQQMQTEMFSEMVTKQKPIFSQITTKLNLNESEMDSCLEENLILDETTNENSAKILQKIVADTYFANMVGLTGTPAIIINGEYAGGYLTYSELKEKIDAALDGNITEDQLYSPEDKYYGNNDAKVVVYVYSDYYCSYCKKLAEETSMQLKSEYIDTGKIKYIPKDLIRAEPSAAVYARCAELQNKYFDAELELFSKSTERSSNLNTVQTAISEKYKTEMDYFNSEIETLQKWATDNPEAFSKIQESLGAQAQ